MHMHMHGDVGPQRHSPPTATMPIASALVSPELQWNQKAIVKLASRLPIFRTST